MKERKKSRKGGKNSIVPVPVCHSCTQPACIGNGELARCETHFKEEFARQMRRTVREFHMIKPGEKVAVALSGGKDSVVMLHQLSSLREKLPMELFAILVDEGIAGYRNPTIAVARRECRKLEVPLHIVTFKSETGKSLDEMLTRTRNKGACTYCGVFRRLLLNKSARRLKADKLALGHNLDDAAQTVLLNLYRNEPARMARFWPVSVEEEGEKEMEQTKGPSEMEQNKDSSFFVPRIRPLISIPEREVALMAELEEYGICHQSCPYAAEAMRQTVRAQLNAMEDRYPGTKKRIFNSWIERGKKEHGRADEKSHQPAAALQLCRTCHEPTSGRECMACRMKTELGAGKKRAKN